MHVPAAVRLAERRLPATAGPRASCPSRPWRWPTARCASTQARRLAAATLASRARTPATDAAFVAAAFERVLGRAADAPRSGPRACDFLADQAGRLADRPRARRRSPPAPPPPVAAVGRPGPAGPREPGPRAVQPQRLRDDPMTVGGSPMRMSRMPRIELRPTIRRRTFLADVGMGFTGLVLGAMLHRDGVARGRAAPALDAARRPAALRAQGQERHLAVHDRRHQPHGELRPQAGAEQVRRQDDRRDARTRTSLDSPLPQEEPPRARRRACTTVQPNALPAAGRLPEARPERASRSATGGRTSATASTTSPSSARCGRPTTTTAPSSSSTPAGTCSKGQFPTIGSWVHYGLGSLNDNLPQFVVLGTPLADCCGGMGGHGGELPRPRARRRPARRRPDEPAAVRLARARTSTARSSAASSSCSAG